jgi:DNA-binding MarR family transcriptional regulator
VTDEKRVLARQILEIIPLVMRTVSAEMRQSDHRTHATHFRLLWILQHHPLTLSALAEHQSVSLPTMSNSVTSLEDRGWFERRRAEDDRRKVLIEITEAGREVLAEVGEHMETRVEAVVRNLAPDKQQLVSEALLILRDRFQEFTEAACDQAHE